MTREQINAMEAGREMNDAIARHVMQFERTPDDDGWFINYRGVEIPSIAPRYSTDLAAAWLVVERLTQKGYGVSVDTFPDVSGCSILKPEDGGCWESIAIVKATTVPLAICRAALLAAGGRKGGL